ncbi:MAG: hypothetical protein V1844_05840, partial [Pseudomonadota bacterium]
KESDYDSEYNMRNLPSHPRHRLYSIIRSTDHARQDLFADAGAAIPPQHRVKWGVNQHCWLINLLIFFSLNIPKVFPPIVGSQYSQGKHRVN